MTPTERRTSLARLQAIGQVLLDARLAALHRAAEARDGSLARLDDLARPVAGSDLSGVAALEVSMRYERWADQRRAEINLVLARQTAAWLEARGAATEAFGKAQALDGLTQTRK